MARSRRSRADEGLQQRHGFFERILFSFMGPPQLGDPNEPVRMPAEVARCSRCGQPWAEHEVVRLNTHSYTRCPTP